MSASATTTAAWNQLPWRTLEVVVVKLQRRICKASHAGEAPRVQRLQTRLLQSRAAKRLAVRRGTQDNPGKHTAGVDGIKSLTPRERTTLADQLGKRPSGRPPRRGWMPKPGPDARRPLALPTRHDRALQALVNLALEPAGEARFAPHSSGFRPGRSVHDAIGAIFSAGAKQPKDAWDADIARCFDRLDQDALLRKLKTCPTLTRRIKAWLKAGGLEPGVCGETDAGTPQGGVLSPLRAHIAVHGLETHLRSQVPTRRKRNPAPPGRQLQWPPQVISYADALVVLQRDRSVIEPCRQRMQAWRQSIGRELREHQTRIPPTLAIIEGGAGFDFLRFQVRQSPARQDNTSRGRGVTPRITPSNAAVKRHWAALSELRSQNKAAKQANRMGVLNPVSAGWANDDRAVVRTKPVQLLAHRRDEQLRRWAFCRHPRKGRRWVIQRDGEITPGQRWDFRDRDGPTLNQHGRGPIVRHAKVPGKASPDDGNGRYWAARRGQYPGGPRRLAALLKRQEGRCEAGRLFFKPEDLIECHHLDGTRYHNRDINLAAVHRPCHDQRPGGRHERSKR